ncbi:MAG: hemerythrin domain-containing protein [Actinobacteria bacterium]|nr:hemerythrin domain-containing protein [Actinomycetota bacterium]
MGDADEDRRKAAQLNEGDVIAVLLQQHARIQDLFEEVLSAHGENRRGAFDELRALLAVHETAEEMVLRPVSSDVAGEAVTDARNAEEKEANKVLAELEDLDVDSADFATQFLQFQKAVTDHAEAEETQEFPAVLAQCDEEQRLKMGSRLKAAESVAPTRPHPSTAGSTAAQWTIGPIASLIDRTRDAIHAAGE